MILNGVNLPKVNLSSLKEILQLHDSEHSNFQFYLAGFQFHAYVEKTENNTRLILLSEFGRLPFTAENPEQRQRALVILSHTHLALRHETIRYGVSKGAKIFLLARLPLSHQAKLDEVLTKIVEVVIGAMPVLTLMNEFCPAVMGRC